MAATSPPVPRRRSLVLGLDPADIPRDWCASDPFLSSFCESLSMLFPDGERFIESVERVRDQVKDPLLRAQVAGFIGQEAMHGREHRAFNDLLARRGAAGPTRADACLRRYFRPGFHPDDRDTGALVAAWRERHFGASGELRRHLREDEAVAG